MNWIFYAFVATIIIHLVGTTVLIADIGENYPSFHKRLGGDRVFFSPFKQLDLCWWIVTRRYIAESRKVLHRYDLYLGNLVLAIVFGIATATLI